MRKRKTRKGTKRADLSRIREALRDQREWVYKGIVVLGEDGVPFEIIDGDVLVDVLVVPIEIEISAVVSSPIGGNDTGIFSVPPIGSEVYVVIPDGDVDYEPTIVGMTAGNSPSGLSASTIVIVAPEGGEVLIHDGDSGEAKELAYNEDLEDLRSKFSSHIHTTTATIGTGSVGVIAPTSTVVDSFEGTTVLKGK